MISLQFEYKPLFRVKVLHEYFTENTSGSFTFVPTPGTVELCNKMSLLLKHSDDELYILCDYFRQEVFRQFLLNQAGNTVKLSFFLFSKNPYFINITNVPMELPDKIFYFSNLHLETKESGNLAQDKFVTSNDLYAASLEINPASHPDQKNTYQLMQHHVKEKKSLINNSSAFNYNALEEGLYNVLANEKEIQKFVHIGNIKGSPIGLIDIILTKKLQDQVIQNIEESEFVSYSYLINFEARKVFWKYIIVPRYLKRVKNLEISQQKGKSGMSFTRDNEPEANKTFISFTSDTPLKYKENYDFELQLKKKESEGEGTGKVIIKKMPYAPFDMIKPVLSEKKSENFYAEIYVYI